MERRKRSIVLLIICGVPLLFCAVTALIVLHARSQAKALVGDLIALDSTSHPTQSFEAFKERYRHFLVNQECDSNNVCQYEFLISNRPLSVFHLIPRTVLRARITLYLNTLSDAGIEYTTAASTEDQPVVHVQEDFCADRTDIGCDHFAINPHGRNVENNWNGIVEFGQLATAEQKQAAWSLNLDCFMSRTGCHDISELSPRIWKVAGVGRVSSRMRSSADSIAEAAEPLPD